MKKISVSFVALCVLASTFTSFSYARTRREDAARGAVVQEVAPPQESAPLLKGPKKTLAVSAFENKAGYRAQFDLGTGLADMLTTSLVKSERFTVVERQQVADVIQEQDFGGTGRTREAGANKIGKMLNAQVLVRGSVTEFEEKSSGGGGGIGFAGISLGSSSSTSHLALNIRLQDVTTGEILDSVRVEGNATDSAMGLSAAVMGAGLNTASYLKTPTGKAAQQAIDQAVAFIIQKMDKVAWQGSIVTVKEDQVYINAGKNSNANIGDEFIVFKKGEDLIDPTSGASLGSTTKNIGEIKVKSIEDKFAIAAATAGDVKTFSAGDIIKLK